MSSSLASASMSKRHPDGAEAVAHILVDAEDAEEVHVGLERRLDRVQLDAAALRNGGDARREAARQAGEHDLDRRRRVVLGGEHLRVIGVDGEGLAARLLRPQPEEGADGRAAVRAVQPLAAGAPLELGGLGGLLSASRAPSRAVDVDAIVGMAVHGRVGKSVMVLNSWICLFGVPVRKGPHPRR